MEKPTSDIFVIVVPGTLLLDLAVAETFHMANQLGADYRLRLVGVEPQVPSSIAGLEISGIEPLPERLPAAATVFIPSSDDRLKRYRAPQAIETSHWLQRVVGPTHRLCTICTGAFLAAQSGLLAGRRCTTHHALTHRLAIEHPEAIVEENRIFVEDGPVFTSAGATTGFDLALHLISQDHGPKMTLEVARMLVVYFRRTSADLQLTPWLLHRNHMHPALHRVQDAVVRKPAQQWTLTSLAREGCTSPRHLARLFHEYADVSPTAYVRKIRLAAAKEIVKSTQHNFARVAEMVGFSSGEQLRRAWRQFEGTTPVHARTSH